MGESVPSQYCDYIITDLDVKYKSVIESLGFKQQFCHFHFIKNIGKKIKTECGGMRNKDEIIKKSYMELDNILYYLKCDDYNKANEYFYNLVFMLDGFNEVM